MEGLDSNSKKIQEYLGMSGRPVGVKLLRQGGTINDTGYDKMEGRKTFCRHIHEAAAGKNFVMRLEHLDCTDAEIILGFRRPRFADVQPRITEEIAAVRIGPVADADIVMLVLNPEQTMTLSNVMPGLAVTFKKNRTVCGEGVPRVYYGNQPTVTLLCIGARTDGAFAPHEMLVSLPYKTFLELPARMSKFASFSRKAMDGLAQRIKFR
jgi:uncharacterized protein (DUF169 family)